MYKRVFLIVCDSMGFGAADDADTYGDAGSDTIGHVAEAVGGLNIPNMEKIGASCLRPIKGTENAEPTGVVALLSERSCGKDTLTGHWEMMGIETEEPFITFSECFPDDLIAEIEKRTWRKVIGNKAASGTVILDELAEEEIKDPSKMIVYTSADSVLQICGSEENEGGLSELYRCCETAREITLEKPEWKVARVIARPYIGKKPGEFTRTSNRKDYSVAPPRNTILNELECSYCSIIGIGKISDIFSGSGVTESYHSDSSVEGMEQVIQLIGEKNWTGLCFCNLSDFDVKWGHRRNPQGYAGEIEKFDVLLGKAMSILDDQDLIIITADHGNDPTFAGTDHTRENVPFLAWSPAMKSGSNLGKVEGFGNIGKTVAAVLGVELEGDYFGRNLLDL